MLTLGIWLVAIGLCDLLRAARDTTSIRRRVLVVVIGLLVLLILLGTFGLSGVAWATLGAGSALAMAAWVLGSSAALQNGKGWSRAVAFVGLGAGLIQALLAGGALEPAGWGVLGSSPLGRYPVELVLLVAGAALAQLSTANLVVRLVLDAVGVPATRGEKQLKGGRVLGPMERLLILGLGVAGSVTAAAIVVAAKGLLRFPELQWGERAGPSDVTEYFLIGSFASWLVALAGVGLVALTR